MSLLKGLNTAQKQAVTLFDKPVLVIAGPGTGKTTVLTKKIAYLLKTTDIKPYSILALTFSESAAINMRQRLAELIGPDAYKVDIFTFHGFARATIERFAEHFAEFSNYEILDDIERVKIFKSILEDPTLKLYYLTGTQDRLAFFREISSAIETLKREGVTLQDLQHAINIEKEVLSNLPEHSTKSKDGKTQKFKDQQKVVERLKELYKVYQAYQNQLAEHRKLDFADLINIVNAKFKEDKDFALKVQEQYEYILVDEYQDTNRAQNQLLFNLLEFWQDNPNVFVVGDDDQAIYRFQGASVANIYDFVNRFEDQHTVVLTYNYRSSQQILNAAAQVRGNISQSITTLLPSVSKDLEAKGPYANLKHKPKLAVFNSETAELLWIIDQIKALHKSGVAYEDIAILVRRNYQIPLITSMLQKHGIPYTRSGSQNAFENPYVLQLVRLLRFINNPSASDFARVLHYSFWGLNKLDLMRFLAVLSDYLHQVARDNIKVKQKVVQFSLDNINDSSIKPDFDYTFVLDLLKKADVSSEFKQQLTKVVDKLLSWHSLAHTLPVLRLVEILLNQGGFIDYVLEQPTKFEDLSAINAFVGNLRTLHKSNAQLLLSEFLEILDLMLRFNITIATEEIINLKQGVNVITAHSAKGLEFEYVFIPQFTARVWSTRRGRSLGIADLFYLTSIYDLEDPSTVKRIVSERLYNINKPKEYAHKVKQLIEDDERRLFYVALTRAKKGVFLSYSKFAIDSLNKVKEQEPAIFLYDIGEDHITTVDTSKYNTIEDKATLRQLFKPTDLNEFYISTASEEEYLKTMLSKFKLSPSALIAYLKDPKEFYLNYFLKVPTVTNLALSYGDAFHKAVEHALRVYKDKKEVPQLDELMGVFKESLTLKPLTKKEEQQLIERAYRELKAYYDARLANLKYYPLYVEKVVTSPFKGAFLKGKIDRVETLDYDKGYVRIVDVKTAAPKSLSYILGTAYNSEKLGDFGTDYLIQLYFYKLLFDLDDKLHKGRRYIPIKAAIDFARPKDKQTMFIVDPVEIEFEQTKYEEFKQLLLKVLEEINSLSFLEGVGTT